MRAGALASRLVAARAARVDGDQLVTTDEDLVGRSRRSVDEALDLGVHEPEHFEPVEQVGQSVGSETDPAEDAAVVGVSLESDERGVGDEVGFENILGAALEHERQLVGIASGTHHPQVTEPASPGHDPNVPPIDPRTLVRASPVPISDAARAAARLVLMVRHPPRGSPLPLAVQIAGQASKRGRIPRLPSAERLIPDIEAWVTREYADMVRSTRTRTRRLPTGESQLFVGLHPAAQDLVLTCADTGRVNVSAETPYVGPGYHTFVSRLVRRLGVDMEIEWGVEPEVARPSSGGRIAVVERVAAATGIMAATRAVGAARATATDLASDFASDFAAERMSAAERAELSTAERTRGTAERSMAERSHLAWLGSVLVAARDARRLGAQGLHIGTPAGALYTFEGAIATSLGPRGDAWLDRAVGDPRTAVDISPWWADATDARYLLNRALCLMWTEVRWRQPSDTAERDVLNEVARLLWRAFPLDPTLSYPWREWNELLAVRGFEEPASRLVRERAAPAGSEGGAPIGYRRQTVRVIHEGWTLEIPGSFAERRTDEEWYGGEGGRSITLAAVETGADGRPMSAEAFLAQVSGDLGGDALTHRAGEVVGRARLGTDASSGVEVGVLEGYSAIRGRGAAVRIVFTDSADWQWALEQWRSLAPA
jgi:hypothetical protein